jgi:hypothetical protein
MKRGRSTGNPTKAQQARHDRIRELGCIVAHLRELDRIPCEIHHTTIGGKHGAKRRGHDFVLGLNQWSHRGDVLPGWTKEECLELLGPSYALEPLRFRNEIGRDDFLLAYQAQILGETTGESP